MGKGLMSRCVDGKRSERTRLTWSDMLMAIVLLLSTKGAMTDFSLSAAWFTCEFKIVHNSSHRVWWTL